MNKLILAAVAIVGGVTALVALRFLTGNGGHKFQEVRQAIKGDREIPHTLARPETGIWSAWNSNSTAEIIERLRFVGCPEQFIEDIAIAEVMTQAPRDDELGGPRHARYETELR